MKNAAKIALILEQYSETNIVLSLDAVGKLARLELQEVNRCVQWLLSKRYVAIHVGEHVVTYPGIEWLRGKQTEKGLQNWKTEALTGIREAPGPVGRVTKQSEIINACLPTASSRDYNRDSPEEYVISEDNKREARRHLMNVLGIGIRQLEKCLSEQRIQMCKSVDGRPHLGIFDKKGNRLQHLCRKCFKKYKGGRR